MDSPIKSWNDGGGSWNDGGGSWNDGGGSWNDGGGSWNDGGGSWNDMICDKNDPHDYAKTQYYNSSYILQELLNGKRKK